MSTVPDWVSPGQIPLPPTAEQQLWAARANQIAAEQDAIVRERAAVRARLLRRGKVVLPLGAVLLALAFGLESRGLLSASVLEQPLHVWVKTAASIFLIVGFYSLRGAYGSDKFVSRL